ncbi:SDR family oxidoreductase [Streptomyces canus]|uniref:SDR family oxidoreductase n=1 Tax=Streptomyces canus TaxID=58343 RepID=UPI00386EF4F1|nr:SDR family oxidoreductase [Streptomyces canus]
MIAVVTGARGLLGSEFMIAFGTRQAALGWSSGTHEGYRQVDVRSADQIARALDDDQPDVVIHCAADPNIVSCEEDPVAARELNALAVEKLAFATSARNIRLVQMSTDYVFAGDSADGYTETDEVNPLQVYGRTKAEAERYCLEAGNSLVVRVPLLFGISHVIPKATFPEDVAKSLSAGKEVHADEVETRQPTFTPDVTEVVYRLVEGGITGVVHVAPSETTTKYGWADQIAEVLELNPAYVRPTSPKPGSNRPLRSVLRTQRLSELGFQPPRGYKESTPAFLRAVGLI